MTKTDKDQRLANRVQVGERMRAFVQDPLISGWFDKAIEGRIADMVDAPIEDDTKRRAAAIAVGILKEIRNLMAHADAEGERAAIELRKRNQRSE